MENGRVSVVLPVYNSEHFLSKCLESILRQSYTNIEIIAIDDGSTDNSYKILCEYQNKDNRVQVYQQKNRGVSATRNRGLRLAKGEYISFIDSDDELENDMYELLIQTLERYSVDIVHCGYKRVNELGEIIKEVSGTHEILVQDSTNAIEYLLEGRYFVGGLWNKLFRLNKIENLYFDERLKNNEDILFNVQAFQQVKKIVFIDETKYRYYEHGESTCNSLNIIKQSEDCVKASNQMLINCKDNKLKECIQKRIFCAKVNLFRLYLDNGCKEQIKKYDIKNSLKYDFKLIKKPSIQMKINYYLLVYAPHVYINIYKIYDFIRKPNWDVKNKR